MMPQPTIGSFAQRVYDSLEPVAIFDPTNYWHLAIYIGALGGVFQPVEDLADDDVDGNLGWSIIVDVDRIPDEGLPYLAQFVGGQVDQKDSADVQRQKVRDKDRWKRGSPDALVNAIKRALTGAQRVKLLERDTGSAWHHNVTTYTSETPDASAVLAAIASQKPAGQIITHTVIAGQDYDDLKANHLNYDAVRAAYANYNAVVAGP